MDWWGCFLLLPSCSLVSGLCSTCLDGRCYDSGECIIGCVRGFVGKYCDEDCPPRCLNKVCHLARRDGTVTCTGGCEPDYCGINCDERCPGSCLTCDRQCDSCNVTLCPERRYGAGCSEICNPRYEKCDRETGQCIRCRRGYYGDKCTRECRGCFTRADNIMDTCLSGCDICHTDETCPVGFHGDSCAQKCSGGCETSRRGCNRATGECSAGCVAGYHGLTCNYRCSEHCLSGRCDIATGECSAGCVSGYHGLTCNNTCSEHCLSGRCNRETGECSAGCVSGYHGLTCNYTCNIFCVGRICNQHNGVCTSGCINGYTSNLDKCENHSSEESLSTAAIAVPIILVCLVAGVVIATVVWRRRRFRRSRKPKTKTKTVMKDRVVYRGLGNKWSEVVDDAVQLQPDESIQVQHLRTRTKDEIEFITAGMIRVSAVDIVLDKLKAGQRWLTITGNAGDGKTTLGYLVLKEFLQNNVHVFTINKPEEYEQIAKMKEDRVVMFDDRFGAFLVDHQLLQSWLDVIKHILSFTHKPDVQVIFVSRRNVLNESRMYLGKFAEKMLGPECVVDLSVRKIIEERLKILEYHLHEHVTVPREQQWRIANKDTVHGFPHCCKMYSKLRSNGFTVDIEEFFESPLKFLDMTTNVLYSDNCKDLFQMMIKNDGKFDVYTVEDEQKRQALLQVEKEQEGSYITVWRNGICQFAHPAVYESVLNVINEIDPLFCVQYANLSVVRQKMLISTCSDTDSGRSPCYIIVKPIPAVLNSLAVRFLEDILKGDYSVFKHKLCQSGTFCEALVSWCVKTHENRSKQSINQPGEDGKTMLWTALKSANIIAVQTLVKAGADVTIHDEKGRTPLQYICQVMNSIDDDQKCLVSDTIRVIISEGRGNINIQDEFGQTPLHYLFKTGTLTAEVIKWIITESKGDLNKREQNMSTPLHYLCANTELQLETVDLLFKEGKGDFNNGDEHGSTPLHYLCDNAKVGFDVICRIVNTTLGDINKQDDNGITSIHVLCKGSHELKDILTLIHQEDKADMFGNTPLHFLCRRRGVSADVLQQQLKQIPEADMKKQNILGYTPLDYLTDQDDSLGWTDGTIHRSAEDLVLCRLNRGDQLIVVLGVLITFKSKKVHDLLQVEDFGRELTNMRRSGDRTQLQLFSRFWGTCTPIPNLLSPFTTPLYLETNSKLTWQEGGLIPLLEIGVVEGQEDLDKGRWVSGLPGSVCLSVQICPRHDKRLCIRVWRRDREPMRHQVGDCVTLSLPTTGDVFTFTFGLVLDVGRGRSRVAFIDVEKGELLCKVYKDFSKDIFFMFYMDPHNHRCSTRMRLISGREISINDRKIQLIQQALF